MWCCALTHPGVRWCTRALWSSVSRHAARGLLPSGRRAQTWHICNTLEHTTGLVDFTIIRELHKPPQLILAGPTWCFTSRLGGTALVRRTGCYTWCGTERTGSTGAGKPHVGSRHFFSCSPAVETCLGSVSRTNGSHAMCQCAPCCRRRCLPAAAAAAHRRLPAAAALFASPAGGGQVRERGECRSRARGI